MPDRLLRQGGPTGSESPDTHAGLAATGPDHERSRIPVPANADVTRCAGATCGSSLEPDLHTRPFRDRHSRPAGGGRAGHPTGGHGVRAAPLTRPGKNLRGHHSHRA